MKNFNEVFKKFKGVDAVVLSSAANTLYLAEYESTFATIILTADGGFYLTDTRYSEEASSALSDGAEVIAVKYKELYSKIDEILNSVGAVKVGFENASITYDSYVALSEALKGKQLIGVEDQILSIRAVKTAAELILIKKAASINDRAFARLLKKVKTGVTERQLAYELEYQFKKLGADGVAFETIVAFGDNTSKPHAHVSDRKLTSGTPITIDFGCKYQGYCSDITRTFCFGQPEKDYIDVYNAVLEANIEGIKAVKAGVSAGSIDAVCRDYLKSLEYDKFFIHGTGHGVGVDIHEAPTLNALSNEVLRRNMVVTVEPGVYIPGFGGVRVEDLLIVTQNGSTVISHTDKKLLIL